MANEGHVVVPRTDDLIKMMDVCQRSLALVEAELPKLKALPDADTLQAFTDMRAVLDENKTRLDNLDKSFKDARKDPFWQADEDIVRRGLGHPGWYTAAYKEVGKVFGVAYRHYKNGYKCDKRDQGSIWDTDELAKRAAEQHGDSDAAGAVLIPEEVLSRTGYIMKEKSYPRMFSSVVPMTTDTARSPVLDQGPIVYYAGQGMGPSAHSKLTFSKQMLETETLIALNVVALELTEDAANAYGPFWTQVFTDAFSLQENRAFLTEDAPTVPGDAFQGVIAAVKARQADQVFYLGGASNSKKTSALEAGAVTYDDLVQMETSTDENTWDGAMYFFGKKFQGLVRGIKNSVGDPIYHTNYVNLGALSPKPNPSAGRGSQLLGDDSYITAVMPTDLSQPGTTLLVRINPKYHFLGDRLPMSIKWSSEAGFADGALVMRARERYASRLIMPAAASILCTSLT